MVTKNSQATNPKRQGARAFLKANGFLMETKPQRIDSALLKTLDLASRCRIEEIWAVQNMGLSNGLEMYQVPQTSKQAALLFSHDWPRAAATMEWFDDVVRRLGCRSVADMGCGAGFLLAYIQTNNLTVEVAGIDAASNLAKIASKLTRRSIMTGDYLTTLPPAAYDLIICDFGFDLARFAESKRPHDITAIAGQQFCRNCSDDLAAQFAKYALAWRVWGTRDASLAISGRFGNYGLLRALMIAARQADWELSLELSRMLKVQNIMGGDERFPALVFQSMQATTNKISDEHAAEFFGC